MADVERQQVRTERMATGGDAVGRLSDGRVVFVRGAVADETVLVEVDEVKRRFARGHAVKVIEPGPDRVDANCIHATNGDCGGCDWSHIEPDRQRAHKVAIVADQLRRLGGIEEPKVAHHPAPRGRRTSARCKVLDGRAGYRRRRGHDGFAATACGATHRQLEAMIVAGRYGSATEVTLRIGSGTGDRLVLTDGPPAEVELPEGQGGSTVIVGADDAHEAITEIVAGRHWRVSPSSFFQTSDIGAEALVDAVRAAAAEVQGPVVDLYGGVGLLGGAATPEHLHTVVESNGSACADARHNLGPTVRVLEQRVETWAPDRRFDLVIADPARAGLGRRGIDVVDRCRPERLVLVSCDPASLGRDAGLLTESGWSLLSSQVIDMFADTSRIEAVSTFVRH